MLDKPVKQRFLGTFSALSTSFLLVFGYLTSTLDHSQILATSLPSFKSLMLSVSPLYMDDSITPIMKQYMIYQTDVLLFHTKYNSQFPKILHVGGGDSILEVRNATRNAEHFGSQIIGYDFEHWAATPLREQSDPIGSVDRAASTIHTVGLKFLFTPDGGYLYGLNQGTPYYQLYHWKNVDYLLMQLQSHKFAGGGSGTNINAFSMNVQKVVNYAKNQNPKIVIFEQLSFKLDSPSIIVQKTDAISDIVNGVDYFYIANQTICSYCTPNNLHTVLNDLRPNL